MPARFTCPHCETEMTVEDQFVGKTGPCHVCGKEITIDVSTEALVSDRSSRPKWPLVLNSFIGGILLLGVTAVVIYTNLPEEIKKRLFPDPPIAAQTNLQQICLALAAYHDQYNTMPPSFVVNDEGEPLYSWRVLILPQLGHQDLYDRFNLEEKWDSPENHLLLEEMPKVFASPTEFGAHEQGITSFLVPVSSASLFPGALALSKDVVADDLDTTLMVIQYHGSGTFWTEPNDYDVARTAPPIGAEDYKERVGFFVATVDGQIFFVPNGVQLDMKALTSVQGGESVNWRQTRIK